MTTIDCTFIGVGSEGELSRSMFCDFFPETQYLEHPQWWKDADIGPGGSAGLRHKFNKGIHRSYQFDPEMVFLIGSDDFYPRSMFAPSDADLIGGAAGQDGGLFFWQYGSLDEAWYWDGKSSGLDLIGGCLGFSTRLLDAYGWMPFQWEGDEAGVVRNITADDRWTIEPRARCWGWHPKTGRTLNSLQRVMAWHDLTAAPRDEVDGWLAYWDSLA
jgi:hypothetical protein